MSAATNYDLNDAMTVGASYITSDQATLLASARAGDSTAFECLVMPHWDALLRVTQRILRNREDAEDAVQTAFLDAFRNLNGIPWAFAILLVAHSHRHERCLNALAREPAKKGNIA